MSKTYVRLTVDIETELFMVPAGTVVEAEKLPPAIARESGFEWAVWGCGDATDDMYIRAEEGEEMDVGLWSVARAANLGEAEQMLEMWEKGEPIDGSERDTR